MASYRVVTGPKVTTSLINGMIFGPNTETSGSPFEAIISDQAKDGYEFVHVFSHQVSGALCFFIPKTVNVNLLVFRKG